MKSLLTFITILSFYSPLLHCQQVSDLFAPEQGQADNKQLKTQTIRPASDLIKSRYAKEFMVVSAHPEASKAAYKVLEQGGNAIDAMVTVQTVLGLVEPQSSGLGGGAFLVYYDSQNNKLTTFDGRETAPLDAHSELFLKEDAQPMAFFDAVVGGRSVGTPGTVKLLAEVHKKYGKKKWLSLLSPAIQLAGNGFNVGPRLANAVKRDEKYLSSDDSAYQYFFPDGRAIQAGQQLKNPAYKNTLVALAKHGGDYFYNSDISQTIVDKVKQASNPGFLSQKDFSDYKVIERQAVCSPYKTYEVCGMGPPSSGATSIAQILGILEPFGLSQRSSNSAETWQLIADASRLAFADRGQYIADPAFVDWPKAMLNKHYLRSRSKLITPGTALQGVSPGVPDAKFYAAYQAGKSIEVPSTSHFVIVDKDKNIVSMTSTIENGFGSRLMVNGFLLNNELTDFSFRAHHKGKLVANRVEPGKRPRSSMAPTIVFKKDTNGLKQPYVALGSPGGSRIINYVANSLIAILDWEKTPQEAFDQAHIVNRFGVMDIEANSSAEKLKDVFEGMGYQTKVKDLNSGLHGVIFTEQGLLGGADKRREGLVLGK
ncbi:MULTISPECIES: gamma-glutamyltransferase [unclassified Oleiphilus]|uniref:gamma-glutamyltransferase n=4 Tax=Oleiphilus TaxID=141450 RepID=UPI0007C39EEB|nr:MULTISPECIES: gamma-glutamyltransferase [unclassified Oleiphilus]KZZ31606.1 gamma-glutamyltransferase [Oleiphilus sp. HI0086]KZZ36161.1 gamma-glutamyltransferase [Oleiphilus sp. HI0117]